MFKCDKIDQSSLGRVNETALYQVFNLFVVLHKKKKTCGTQGSHM